MLSDFSAAAGSCERRDQASPGGLIKGVEAHQLARIGQRLFGRCAQTFDQRAQYLCLQLARVFAHSEQPCVKIAVLRQFEIGEERAAKERCGARKIAGRGRLFLGADLRGKEIDVEPLAAQLHALAIRQQAGERGIVDQRADLAEAPAKRGSGIIGNVPEHFAEMVAPLRSSQDGEVGNERPRLSRWRQHNGIAIAQDLQFAQDADLQSPTHAMRLIDAGATISIPDLADRPRTKALHHPPGPK